ncbi:DUF6361 family protein [Actinopolymorpha pittospori]|uniref:Uncharacterized protein n=1 Tax=Actinopolymorpha pittospori TaxID=648752 RepID=A0A927RHQ5_9ACTN|nr:DUF6361 family protein [Actinopolymorpha pittospori]MBE1603723.1 hypothetical protein [Actinopolymorpha pittospori]
MGSSLSWLDSSREDQRRIRELLQLFSQTESRDELGIGQVRDAFSELLFPGTSVLLTRARYLLIVPWCYLEAERRGLTGSTFTAAVEKNERKVVATLRRAGVTDGLIGRVAGVAVKTLPSTIYWTSLGRYGIRRVDEPTSTMTVHLGSNAEADELTDREPRMWHPTLPPVPHGFPGDVPGGLDLSHDEASWLRDRMLTGVPHSLLVHLLDEEYEPSADSIAPWADPAAAAAPPELATGLRHAELFSLAVHGAALLYNLQIAERYEAEKLTQVEYPVDHYRERLKEWSNNVQAEYRLPSWDRTGMWSIATRMNPKISKKSSLGDFLDRWLAAVADGSAAAAVTATDITQHPLAQMVAKREETVKKAQSRLVNKRLLRSWSGASGSDRLTYRWVNVRRILGDIHDGLGREANDASA